MADRIGIHRLDRSHDISRSGTSRLAKCLGPVAFYRRHHPRHAPTAGTFLADSVARGLEHEDDRCPYPSRRFSSPPGERLLSAGRLIFVSGWFILSLFPSPLAPAPAPKRRGCVVVGPGLIWGTGLNLCRCTKAQYHLKIPPKSSPPSIFLWLPPVRPMTSAANDGH